MLLLVVGLGLRGLGSLLPLLLRLLEVLGRGALLLLLLVRLGAALAVALSLVFLLGFRRVLVLRGLLRLSLSLFHNQNI